jgi:hypothetical protein
MRSHFEIGLESLPLDGIEAELVVAGFFVQDRPLRGGAGRVDWRLCGMISELLASGKVSAERGSAMLIAAPGAFKAPRILLLGMGDRADFALTAAQDVMRKAMERCIALGVRRIAFAPLGIAADDFVRHAAAVVGGAAEALRSYDEVADVPGDFEVCLSLPEAVMETASKALDHAVDAFEGQGIVTRPAPLRQHSPSPLRRGPPRGPVQPRP